VIIGAPFATSVTAAVEDTLARLCITGDGKQLRAVVWVAPTRPLAVIELETDGLSGDDLWVRVYRHRDTIVPGAPGDSFTPRLRAPTDFEQLPAPCCWRQGAYWGVVQSFPAESTFPDGFSFVTAAAALGAEPIIACVDGRPGLGTTLSAEQEGRVGHGVVKRYTPINRALGAAATARFDRLPPMLTLAATIATTQDGRDLAAVARATLDAALALGVEGLREERNASLRRGRRKHAARATVGEAVEFAAPIVLPRLRRSGGYYGDLALCSVDSTKFCFQDSSPWHADFHLNEVRAEEMLTLGRFKELLPYCEMIHAMLPQAQENARDVYALPGAMYPLVHFPLRCRGVAHVNLTWEQDLGLNGLVTKPLWLYYRYTGDGAFLRKIAWPVLRECARFMAAYLTEEADRRLHIVPTVSPEHWGLTARFERNRDCLSALTMTRYLLLAAASAAQALGLEDPEAAAWQEATIRLARYPTCATDAGPVWTDVAGAPPIEYNIPVPLAAVFWGDDVGLDSSPELLTLAHRTLEQIRVWPPHRFYLDRTIRPRLGVCVPDAPISLENLLLSYQSIRIFPAVPPQGRVVMEDFAAQGGFRVSAQRTQGGDIADVRISSLLGEPCCVANPWPGRGVAATTRDGREVARAAAPQPHLAFATTRGEEYHVRPL
jgi:hypothetical protein